MIAKVQKWGNSLAVRIPRSVALDTHLSSGKTVDMAVHDGQIIIAPTKHKEYKLNDLLRGITIRNKHHEFDTGNPVGHEVW
ncbi:MAG: hypothetical protein ACD_79C01288G0004 [uncultured bacterium]|nr:MAG: hypothetical protein ACD_79C01288G0004 [uncultured bacterium]